MTDFPASDRLIRSIPDGLWRQVKIASATEGVTIRQLVIEALERRLGTAKTSPARPS